MTDDELIAEIIRLGELVSYYNAAEGEAYWKETKERQAAKDAFYSAVSLADARNLKRPGGFML